MEKEEFVSVTIAAGCEELVQAQEVCSRLYASSTQQSVDETKVFAAAAHRNAAIARLARLPIATAEDRDQLINALLTVASRSLGDDPQIKEAVYEVVRRSHHLRPAPMPIRFPEPGQDPLALPARASRFNPLAMITRLLGGPSRPHF